MPWSIPWSTTPLSRTNKNFTLPSRTSHLTPSTSAAARPEWSHRHGTQLATPVFCHCVRAITSVNKITNAIVATATISSYSATTDCFCTLHFDHFIILDLPGVISHHVGEPVVNRHAIAIIVIFIVSIIVFPSLTTLLACTYRGWPLPLMLRSSSSSSIPMPDLFSSSMHLK